MSENFNTYQAAANCFVTDHELDSGYFGLGLGGEAGEVLEILKKAERKYGDPDVGLNNEPELRAKLLLELGDVLWYLSRIAHMQGFKLSEVAEANIEKLTVRAAEGTLAAITRPDGGRDGSGMLMG